MKKKKPAEENLRIDKEKQVCPVYDSTGVRKYPVAKPDEMGVRVVDDCAEEHIQ